jgi:putative ABC transport system ATP-binding protein
MKEILKLDHIQKYYGNGGNVTKAIQDISFSVQEEPFCTSYIFVRTL